MILAVLVFGFILYLNLSVYNKDDVNKLYLMSLRSESSFVRSRALLNLRDYDSDLINSFKEEILKLKSNPTKSTTKKEMELMEQVLNK